MTHKNVAVQPKMRGIEYSLATPGRTTPQYSEVTGKAVSHEANNLEAIVKASRYLGAIAQTQFRLDRQELIRQQGIGTSAALIDVQVAEGIFNAGPTDKTIGDFPPVGLDEAGWVNWATESATQRGAALGLQQASLSTFVERVAPELLKHGMAYDLDRRKVYETAQFSNAAFAVVNDPNNLDDLDLDKLLGRTVNPTEIFDNVMLPAVQTMLDTGDYKGVQDVLKNRVPGISPKKYSEHVKSAHEGLLPSLSKSVFDALDDNIVASWDDVQWREFVTMVSGFEKTQGGKADTAIAEGFESWLENRPSQQAGRTKKLANTFVSMVSEKGSALWHELKDRQYSQEERMRREADAIFTRNAHVRTEKLQAAEIQGANLLAENPTDLAAKEKAMFDGWATTFPSLHGVMRKDYATFKKALTTALETPASKQRFIGIRESLDDALTMEEMQLARSDIATAARNGKITLDQYTRLITTYNNNLEVIEGKKDEFMEDARDAIFSEWDTRLGVEITPTGRRRTKPEYGGSEIKRAELVAKFNKEWRAWMRTPEVLAALKKPVDWEAWTVLRDEKLAQMLTGWTDTINKELNNIVGSTASSTKTRASELGNP